MTKEPQRTCPSCGNELSEAMEFCPICMLRQGLPGGLESGESSFEEAAKATLEQAGQRFEHYELVTGDDGKPIELGRGAMGVTYKAFDVDLRLPVTLKLISERYIGDQSAVLRFLREARAAAKVRHSNIASVFHLGRSGENYFYAMEFVEGETLESLIKRPGRIEVKLALEIARQVAAGLAAIYEQNLVHCDIKPTNVIVKLKDGDRVTAKIIDLGLAKTVGDFNSESAISVSGGFAGTPEFASPEQFVGLGVDIRSDLYSLGATLWEMLSGQTPFRGSPSEVMYQHQNAPLPLEQMKGVPQPVVALLEVLLEKDHARRLQSPAELLNALSKVTDALKAGRTITNQSLREIADQPLGASGKAIAILRDVFADRRVPLILWAALVIAGGAILAVSIFYVPKSSTPQASRGSSPTITATEKSIAVLPFESLSDNKSDAYFADGVQDEILSNLAKVSELRVISRTSVMTYRSVGNRNLRAIAAALDVARVLEGTVRRDGNRVRIATELIDAETDRTLWSDSFDRDLTDIFAIQSESYLRQYRACEKILDRLIELEPDKHGLRALKASETFAQNADLTAYRAALEALPSSLRDNEVIFPLLVDALVFSRDWKTARELVRSSSKQEIPYVFGAMVPREFLEIRIAKYQGEHPEMDPEFGSARDRFLQKVNQYPEDPKLLSALGLVDAYLGRKQEAIQEARRAEEMLPVSKDALDGPNLVDNLATVYVWTNEPDLAFQTLDVSIRTPGNNITYGQLKLDPAWDPIRTDPRFSTSARC